MGVELLEIAHVDIGQPLVLPPPGSLSAGFPPLTSATLTVGNSDGSLPIDAVAMTLSAGNTTVSASLSALPAAGNYPVHIAFVPVSGDPFPANFTLDYGAGTSLTSGGSGATDPPPVGTLKSYTFAPLSGGQAADPDTLIAFFQGARQAAGFIITATGGTFTVASHSQALTAFDGTPITGALSSLGVDSSSAAASHSVAAYLDATDLDPGLYEFVVRLTMDDGQTEALVQTIRILAA